MNPVTKKILSISNPDAFDDFTWRGSELKRLNLVYGWNGSGKTSVSRVFTFLEHRKRDLPGLESVKFSLATSGGTVNAENLADHPLSVRVFNEDFIRVNLGFDESKAKKIVIIGTTSLEGAKTLDGLEKDLKEVKDALAAVEGRARELPKSDKTLTDAGRAVTKVFGNTPLANDQYYGRSYTRTRVETLLANGVITAENLGELILPQDQMDHHRDTIRTQRDAIPLNITVLGGLPEVFKAANALFTQAVSASAMESLKDDVELLEWKERGYHLHVGRQAETCLFCSKPLDPGFLQVLGRHFTEELTQHREAIKQSVVALENARRSVGQPEVEGTALYLDLQKRYEPIRRSILRASRDIATAIDALISGLKERDAELFRPNATVREVHWPDHAVSTYQTGLADLRALIMDHNQRVENAGQAIAAAAKATELSEIATVLANESYFETKAKHDDLIKERQPLMERVAFLESRIVTLRGELQDARIAVDKINEYLAEFFGPRQIYLEIDATTSEIGYALKSRGRRARYLSEGEKSIIALAYFLIKLQEDGCDRTRCVIVIDDPVDSQDGVFLFRTFGLMKRELGTAAQLIVLTHNFEFFNLFRDWFVSSSKESQLFLVEMKQDGERRGITIDDLPRVLSEYKSEYEYLCCRLLRGSKGTESLDPVLVANVARKVLEYFASFKWCCKTTEQFRDVLFKRFVSSEDTIRRATGESVLKFLNEYSHGKDFSRSVAAPALEAEAIAGSTLKLIELADEEHFAQLAELAK